MYQLWRGGIHLPILSYVFCYKINFMTTKRPKHVADDKWIYSVLKIVLALKINAHVNKW
jgi:hypothetical protein